jgi:hypothetical protein
MEAESWTTIFVNEEFLEVPCDIINTDWVVDKFVSFSDLDNSLWATVL